MKPVHVTKHARKRIERGDSRGLRTVLSPHEIVELIQSDAALKHGQIFYAFSPADEKTLKVVTARQGKVIVTVYDTARESTRMADMVSRRRAGYDSRFSEASAVTSFIEQDAMRVALGTLKEKRDHLRTKDLVQVCSYFGLDWRDPESLASREVHEMIVDAAQTAITAGLVSKTASKQLFCFFHTNDRQLGIVPVWVSYELLGRERPS